MSVPGYWQNETGDELKPAIIAYLENRPLTARQIEVFRLYLKQWIDAPGWVPTEELVDLREGVSMIRSVHHIEAWLAAAMDIGIDPL
jgi:hypothetical protein